MKIEKYILHLHPAIVMASKRMGIPRLSLLHVSLLYMIRLRQPVRTGALRELCEASELAKRLDTMSVALAFLREHELVQRDEKLLYSLTYRGRDYLSYIRRYLLHKRL